MGYSFNPFTGKLDYFKQQIVTVSSDPTTGAPGVLYMVSGDPTKLWYFIGGNRYYISGTESNPSVGQFFFADGSTGFEFVNGTTDFDYV